MSQTTSDRIAEQASESVVPERLVSTRWDDDHVVRLLDAIASNSKLETRPLASFSQIAGEALVHIHPVADGLVDTLIYDQSNRPGAFEWGVLRNRSAKHHVLQLLRAKQWPSSAQKLGF